MKIFDSDNFKELWQTIRRNKFRSLLTGFGVAWGILMFVILSGIGNGFKHGIDKIFTGLAQNALFVFSGPTTMEYKGFNAGRDWDLEQEDMDLIIKQIPEIEEVSGMLWTRFNKVIKGDQSYDASMIGIGENYIKIDAITVREGRSFNRIDMLEKRKTCLIGKDIAAALFKTGNSPVGDYITVNGVQFTIIGVISGSEKVNIVGRVNESIYAPISTLQQLCGEGNNIHLLCIKAYDEASIEGVEEQVKQLLKARHQLHPDDEGAVRAFNMKEFFGSMNHLFTGLTILIWIVGMGTLLSGMVGVSNIMLVSVRERTKEIGIRRALGAKPSTILRQILSESILLSFLAGYSGLFVGVLILALADKLTYNMQQSADAFFYNPQLSFSLAITALIILLITGLLAGIMPAQNALKIKAIDALRDE
ncbi:MAG: ABC transporter permease [Bacteroidales bacterium]|jgi:putative ABC transport system permease protein|nr:ABC transporter permease [Bacteroidales bacterium]